MGAGKDHLLRVGRFTIARCYTYRARVSRRRAGPNRAGPGEDRERHHRLDDLRDASRQQKRRGDTHGRVRDCSGAPHGGQAPHDLVERRPAEPCALKAAMRSGTPKVVNARATKNISGSRVASDPTQASPNNANAGAARTIPKRGSPVKAAMSEAPASLASTPLPI
jgi:hypothetical protein